MVNQRWVHQRWGRRSVGWRNKAGLRWRRQLMLCAARSQRGEPHGLQVALLVSLHSYRIQSTICPYKKAIALMSELEATTLLSVFS